MNPLYRFLSRLTKSLEKQADLDVVNKLLVIYFINIVAVFVTLGYGLLAFYGKNYSLGWFLVLTSLVLVLILIFLYYTRRQKLVKLLLILAASVVIFYLLYMGGTSGLGMYWLLIFPAFCYSFIRS